MSVPRQHQLLSLRSELLFLVAVTLWLVFYQAALRSLFFYNHQDLAQNIPAATLLIAYGNGIRFDLIITVYAVLPMVIGLLFQHSVARRRAMRIWLSVFAAFITFLAVLELNFYEQFHQRLNSLVFEYMKEDPHTVLSMVWFGFPVLRYLLLIALLTFIFHKVVGWLDQLTRQSGILAPKTGKYWAIRSLVFLLVLGFTTAQARGTLRQGPPLRWGDAFFSEHTFANHLGLNSAFTLSKAATALINKKHNNDFWFNTMPEKQAIDLVRQGWLTARDQLVDVEKAPLRRLTTPPTNVAPKIKNVVIILMESFSAEYVGALGRDAGVTPAFDGLAKQGLLFERFFSNGTHTHQGMFATLACFPNVPGHEYLMYQPEGAHSFSGIAKLLPAENFSQTYVYNGSFTWDNQEGFFKNQGMKNFVGREQYINPKFSDPTWGVSDEDMFDRALSELDNLPKDKPFYAVLQTLSNHTPYALPEPLPMEQITVNGQFSEKLTAMRYADYALGKFFERAQQADYYRETLFVLLGDHGFGVKNQLTALDLLRFHVPLLLIGPGVVEQYGRRTDTVATQVDVLPTVMSLLGEPYRQQCWGRDVLNLPDNDRGLAVVKPSGSDPSVAIISDNLVLVRDPGETLQLYRYQFQPEASVTPHHDPVKQQALWQTLQAYIQTALVALRDNTTAP